MASTGASPIHGLPRLSEKLKTGTRKLKTGTRRNTAKQNATIDYQALQLVVALVCALMRVCGGVWGRTWPGMGPTKMQSLDELYLTVTGGWIPGLVAHLWDYGDSTTY